ncbi:Zinc finger CCCH domain-containing protein 3 [Galdieria sulphuraria]|nr:Zinc finger CCCH domain-containing protein 3 [Galdieria sulphuraria]
MKSFKRPRYSLRRATRHGTGPVPTITQSQKLPSQRSSVNASVIVEQEREQQENQRNTFESCSKWQKFGLCTDKQCRFIHDPERVFVCRRFISGSCQNPGCKLLHTREENRMPVCLRFLSGLCGKNNYFVFRGFCSQGRLCCRLHTWDCVEFWKTGQCSNFEKCPLRHKLCQFGKREKVP